MYSISSLLLLATFSNALPNLTPRGGYGSEKAVVTTPTTTTTSKQLLPEYAKVWYRTKEEQSSDTTAPSGVTYQCFGPTTDKFPAIDKWLNFNQLWQANEPEILGSNGGNEEYSNFIKEAIEKISLETLVDERLILAVVMQESTGKVQQGCTGPCGTDCGMMQIRGGRNFSSTDPGTTIHDMIYDGINGLAPGGFICEHDDVKDDGRPGYLDYFNADPTLTSWILSPGNGVPTTETWWKGNPYAAARIYNAGNLTPNIGPDIVKTTGAPNVYAIDIANRLSGWVLKGGNRLTCG